jgi:hypothetical protein
MERGTKSKPLNLQCGDKAGYTGPGCLLTSSLRKYTESGVEYKLRQQSEGV